MQQFILLGVVLPFARALFGLGSCLEQPRCSSTFQLEPFKHQGLWFVVERDEDFEHSEARIIRIKDRSTVEETVTKNLLNVASSIESRDLSINELEASVVLSDYDNFAVTMKCKDYMSGTFHLSSAAILARAPRLEEAYLEQARDFLESICSYNPLQLSKLRNWGIDSSEEDPSFEALCLEASDFDDSVDLPARMDSPTTSLDGSQVKVSWSAPILPEGTTLQGYKIMFKTHGGDFMEINDCSGCQKDIIKSRSCSVPVSALWQEPFELNNEPVIVAISALNEGGYSLLSYESSQDVQVPHPYPRIIQNLQAVASRTFIDLAWHPPKDTGCCEVTGYQISSSCADTVTVGPASRSYLIQGLEPLQTCSVVISAINEKGVGDGWKEVIEVRGQEELDGIHLEITDTELASDLKTFTVKWSMSFRSSTVRYLVEFKDAKGNFFEHPDCQGDEAQQSRICNINLTTEQALEHKFWMAESAVRVRVLRGEEELGVSPTVNISYPDYVPESGIDDLTGTWSAMKFTCKPAVGNAKYEVLMKDGHYSTSPDSPAWWDTASLEGTSLNSNEVTVSPAPYQTAKSYLHYFGCKATNPFGVGEIKKTHYINLDKGGNTGPNFAQSPQIISKSLESLTIEWDTLEENGGNHADYTYIYVYEASDHGGKPITNIQVNKSPATVRLAGNRVSMQKGHEYTVYIDSYNLQGDQYTCLYFIA